jgi:hypothetical protein
LGEHHLCQPKPQRIEFVATQPLVRLYGLTKIKVLKPTFVSFLCIDAVSDHLSSGRNFSNSAREVAI